MRPQFLRVEVVLEREAFEKGREFHYTGLREKVAAKAEAEGFALIGHEVFEYVWLVKAQDNPVIYKTRNHDNGATHVKVAHQRQAVSRKVRL